MSNTSIILNMRLPADHVDLLRKEALREDLNTTQLLRRIIREYIEKNYEIADTPLQTAAKPPTMGRTYYCRRCSKVVTKEEYNDCGGYCEEHKKAA